MKKRFLLFLSSLCLLCGCGGEKEIPDGEQNIQYIDFQEGRSLSKEEKEEQYLEYLETILESTIVEAFEFKSVSVEIRNTDSSYVVSIVMEPD